LAEALTPFLPLLDVEESDLGELIEPHPGDQFGPERDPARIARDGRRIFPGASGPIFDAGQDMPAVGAEADDPDRPGLHEGRSDRRPVVGTPDPGGPVLAAGQDGPAVRTEGDGGDWTLVLHGSADRLAVDRTPEPGHLIVAAGQEGPAVWTE